jgi:hypothetical protein
MDSQNIASPIQNPDFPLHRILPEMKILAKYDIYHIASFRTTLMSVYIFPVLPRNLVP